MTNHTYAIIHDDCWVEDEIARVLDSYTTIFKPVIVPKVKRNPLGIGLGSLVGKRSSKDGIHELVD